MEWRQPYPRVCVSTFFTGRKERLGSRKMWIIRLACCEHPLLWKLCTEIESLYMYFHVLLSTFGVFFCPRLLHCCRGNRAMTCSTNHRVDVYVVDLQKQGHALYLGVILVRRGAL